MLCHGIFLHRLYDYIWLYVPNGRCTSRIWIWGGYMGIGCVPIIPLGFSTNMNLSMLRPLLGTCIILMKQAVPWWFFFPDVTFHSLMWLFCIAAVCRCAMGMMWLFPPWLSTVLVAWEFGIFTWAQRFSPSLISSADDFDHRDHHAGM